MLKKRSSSLMARVCIGVCTRNRPILLSQCLESIQDLDIPDMTSLSVVVIDNAETASQRLLVDGFKKEYPFSLKIDYVHECRRGVAHARNAVLRYAQDHLADWIVMIDDDQRVPGEWLVKMLDAQHTTGADVIESTVAYQYPDPLPTWAFPRKSPYKWKVNAETARASGILFSSELINSRNASRFREIYNCGNEDRDFFLRARQLGAEIVRTPDAVATEVLTPEKLKFWYQIKDQFFSGWLHANQNAFFYNSSSMIFYNLWKSMKLLLMGLFSMLFAGPIFFISWKKARKKTLKGAKKIAKSFGFLTGLFWDIRHIPPKEISGY